MFSIDSSKLGKIFSFCLLIYVLSSIFLEHDLRIYFSVFFIASALVIAFYGFTEKWISGNFQRPIWLEALYLIVLAMILVSISATGLNFGDMNVWRNVGFGSFTAGTIGISIEAFLGILGFKIGLGVKGKLRLAFVVIGSLFMTGTGIAVLMDWDGPWDSW